ncbi:uncharacterized protein LOC111038659 isoform X1 [Myzus persicae]|uniref:uncharacterized protein LOC111038659 isoform X1 n=1 Tax=Myzus persicae TaxID=13164 RepID=UPI000B9393CA|nr:uncharacterized protein LOC111038659 isoform X1 [Myzus persicae]XP_022177542.1 uncharacterized protein LOC111038659 isoform X1 [Myzus persicae]
MWLVVNFSLDDTVEVVPQKWLNIRRGVCAWPKCTKKMDVEKAIKNKINANKNEFYFFEARALSSVIDSYKKAIRKCNIAKSKSDLSSSAEEPAFKKKMRKQRKASISESNSDGEISDTSLIADSLPSCSTDDELDIRKTIQESSKNSSKCEDMAEKKTINGWSPLKTSVDSSFVTPASIHGLVNNEMTDSSELIDNIGFTSDKTLTTSTAAKDNSHSSSGVNRRLIYSELDTSQTTNKSPIISSAKTSLFDDSSVQFSSVSIVNSPSMKIKTVKKDDQYTKLLNYIITMKYEIRSVHEKLDILIQSSEDYSMTKTREPGVYDTLCVIDSRLPIENEEKLETFENILLNDKCFRNQLVLRLSSVGGKSIKCMVKRIMTLLFTPEILCKFSYNGRGNKKRAFEKLLVKNVIFDSIKNIKKFALSDNSSNEIEQVIKYVLIQTPFKIKNKTSG